MSFTSTIHITGERMTHSYKGALYVLPSDEEERQRYFAEVQTASSTPLKNFRLLKQHQHLTHLFSGRLIFPPITLSGDDEVLDIGTGGGAWICDVKSKLPESVQLYGLDIESRLFPNDSANLHLSVCSGHELPTEWGSKFTLVHQRLLILAYTRNQWISAIQEMYRVLVPGGYAQLIEVGPEWLSGSKTARHMLFKDSFLGEKGMLLRIGVYLADMLKAAGFTEVTSEEVVMKMGKWGGEDGIRGKEISIGAWRGMKGSVMKVGGCGRFSCAGEFDKAMDEIMEEWDNIEGSHTTIRVFYARKPL